MPCCAGRMWTHEPLYATRTMHEIWVQYIVDTVEDHRAQRLIVHGNCKAQQKRRNAGVKYASTICTGVASLRQNCNDNTKMQVPFVTLFCVALCWTYEQQSQLAGRPNTHLEIELDKNCAEPDCMVGSNDAAQTIYSQSINMVHVESTNLATRGGGGGARCAQAFSYVSPSSSASVKRW